MLRFVALFAFVAVAAAEPEPQWGVEHMKTPSGDTVSVKAAKDMHHQLKAAEYIKKGYAAPIVYANKAVYANPAVYAPYSGVPVAQYTGMPVVNHGVYSYGLHHLGKRDADSDSQMIYSTGYGAPFYNTYNNLYNTAGVYGSVAAPVYKAPVSVASPVASYNGVYNGVYNTYAGVHHIGKREADSDSDSQMVYTSAYGGYPVVNTATYGNVYKAGVYGAAFPAMSTYTNGVYSSFPSTYYSGYAGHRVFKRDAEADSQWVYNGAYTPYAGYTGYTGFNGYTAPYNYNVWNRAQYQYLY